MIQSEMYESFCLNILISRLKALQKLQKKIITEHTQNRTSLSVIRHCSWVWKVSNYIIHSMIFALYTQNFLLIRQPHNSIENVTTWLLRVISFNEIKPREIMETNELRG